MLRFLFLTILLVFGAFSTWVTLETSYAGAFPPFDDLNTLQIFLDLVISASLVVFFMFRERRASGRSLWPLAVVAMGVALFGSIALLAYLVVDAEVTRRAPPSG